MDYRAAQDLTRYRITPEPELKSTHKSDDEGESHHRP